jgi:hypothetical protein
MSAEAVVIKRLAKALQEIAKLDDIDTSSGIDAIFEEVALGEYSITEVTPEMRVGLNYAANMAKEALKGIVVT